MSSWIRCVSCLSFNSLTQSSSPVREHRASVKSLQRFRSHACMRSSSPLATRCWLQLSPRWHTSSKTAAAFPSFSSLEDSTQEQLWWWMQEAFVGCGLSITIFFLWWWLPLVSSLFSPVGLGYWPSWATRFQGYSVVLSWWSFLMLDCVRPHVSQLYNRMDFMLDSRIRSLV